MDAIIMIALLLIVVVIPIAIGIYLLRLIIKALKIYIDNNERQKIYDDANAELDELEKELQNRENQ